MKPLVDNILKLVQIPSISGDKAQIRRVVDLVKNELAPQGAIIREFDFEGADPVLLLANCPGERFDILTVGHLDVVPAAQKLFVPKTENGRLYARGALDMKSSVVVNLAALAYAMNKNIRFGVLITTDEETSSNGIKALVKNQPIEARIVFDTDAGSLDTLCDKAKHPVTVKINAVGENAHSSRPWDGINAVTRLTDCLTELEKNFTRFEKGQTRPESIWVDTMVVTAFNSPTTYNMVPAQAEALVNFRLTEKISLPQLEQKLRKSTRQFGCNYEILLCSRGVYMDADCPEIAAYREIVAQTIGRPLKISQMCGGTDARMFSDRSVIVMHSVNGENAHGDLEYVELDSVEQLLEIEKKYIDAFIAGKI